MVAGLYRIIYRVRKLEVRGCEIIYNTYFFLNIIISCEEHNSIFESVCVFFGQRSDYYLNFKRFNMVFDIHKRLDGLFTALYSYEQVDIHEQ